MNLKKVQKLIDMELGESIEIDEQGSDSIERVPGGWVYERYWKGDLVCGVFVPLPEKGKE